MQGFREVREPTTGKLLFRFDPQRDLIEIVSRRLPVIVDLTRYREDSQGLDNSPDRVKISMY